MFHLKYKFETADYGIARMVEREIQKEIRVIRGSLRSHPTRHFSINNRVDPGY
jgi:hypothetical protein